LSLGSHPESIKFVIAEALPNQGKHNLCILAARAKTPFLGKGPQPFFLGENMRDFGILWEKWSQI
jgi:hypothetical protein